MDLRTSEKDAYLKKNPLKTPKELFYLNITLIQQSLYYTVIQHKFSLQLFEIDRWILR